jgi:hypothetical protein
MKLKTYFAVLLLCILAPVASTQVVVDQNLIERQQDELSLHFAILHSNVLTGLLEALSNTDHKGLPPFPQRDNEREREDAWSPVFEHPKDIAYLNDGLGCIRFLIPANHTQRPNICAPVDVRARLTMEALREDWDNVRSVPKGRSEYLDLLNLSDGIQALWQDEKTTYCRLRPEAQYIELKGSLASCTGTVEQTPTIRVNSFSSFIWNGPICHAADFQTICEKNPVYDSPAVSSLAEDPLSGRKIHKLSYGGVEVGSYLSYSIAVGFSKIREFIVANITVVNASEIPMEVTQQFNGTLPAPSDKDFAKRNLGTCPYFWTDPKRPIPTSSGSVPAHSSRQFSILMAADAGQTNMQRWSAESNVYSVTSIRYTVRVQGTDFIFPWLVPIGAENVNAGKCYDVPEWKR